MAGDYQARLERVYARIHADPAGDLSLDRLADVAALSRFHFHRIFTAMTGETLAEAVRRIRLYRAAEALCASRVPVARIARAHGYPNPGSFSRAFRAVFGQTPAEFRAAGRAPVPLAGPAPITGDPAMYDVTITEAPARRLLGVAHTGPYAGIGAGFDRLAMRLAARGLWPAVRAMVAVHHDDPSVTPSARLRALAAVEVGPDTACPEGLIEAHLPGGRHAVLAFTGPYPGLPAAYEWLYGTWLRDSGARPGGISNYAIHRNSPVDTAPEALRTDIFLPLET